MSRSLASRVGDEDHEPLREVVAAVREALAAEGGEGIRLGAVESADALRDALAMTAFERDLLLLCAAARLDAEVAEQCRGQGGSAFPSFALASRVLADAHWSALHPMRPLRWWSLVETDEATPWAPLRLDDRILHQLLDLPHVDERLAGFVRPLPPPPWRLPSLRQGAEPIAELVAGAEDSPSVVALVGAEGSSRRAVAFEVAHALGQEPFLARAHDLPRSPADRQRLARLWGREVVLAGGLLVVDAEEAEAGVLATLGAFVEELEVPVVVLGSVDAVARHRATHVVEVEAPAIGEVLERWQAEDGPEQWSLEVADVLDDHRLSLHQLDAVRRQLLLLPEAERGGSARAACRAQVSGNLQGLAQRLDADARWDDLILPENQHAQLRQIVAHVRYRRRVYETWGFAERGRRGLGICALFHGASGTGKTTAAEVIASELGLSLYRVDLSQVVSKYIGETEKKLEQIFAAADGAGVVLLFDEADALFGKRTEVRDSHDRYANIEVSYLLQRLETYRGLAVLTSNHKAALDDAFTRRLRFCVEFPFPDREARRAIWSLSLPPRIPRAELDLDRLAELSIGGGDIRNIVLAACVRAAVDARPLSMSHLQEAARLELAKRGRTVSEAAMRRWA